MPHSSAGSRCERNVFAITKVFAIMGDGARRRVRLVHLRAGAGAGVAVTARKI
jgi:hypothetical protein